MRRGVRGGKADADVLEDPMSATWICECGNTNPADATRCLRKKCGYIGAFVVEKDVEEEKTGEK